MTEKEKDDLMVWFTQYLKDNPDPPEPPSWEVIKYNGYDEKVINQKLDYINDRNYHEEQHNKRISELMEKRREYLKNKG